jgi:threonine/homoserine/homoserine lactone efflux protein
VALVPYCAQFIATIPAGGVDGDAMVAGTFTGLIVLVALVAVVVLFTICELASVFTVSLYLGVVVVVVKSFFGVSVVIPVLSKGWVGSVCV